MTQTAVPGLSPSFGSGGDEERRRALRVMRTVATGLLVVAAIVYVLTRDTDGVLGFVNAAAEASMVGAIADWFAVTALFRHPLGLPVPHTALVPKRKNELAVSLEEFVTDNFLAEEAVRTQVREARVAERVGEWLQEPENATWAVGEASTALSAILRRLKDDDVETLVRTVVLPRLADEPLARPLGEFLAEVVRDKAHHGVVDLALDEIHRWLSENGDVVDRILAERAPWWTPQWLDDRVIGRLRIELVSFVADIRDDPDHHARQAIDRLLAQLAHDLQHDDEVMARAEALKVRVLEGPGVADTAVALWHALRATLLAALDDSDGVLHQRAVDEITAFGQRIVADDELRTRADRWAEDAAAYVVERYGTELTTVISATVQRWDGRETANRIELFVGRDLQFIRINGTVVGGLVGTIIHAFDVLV